MFPTTTKNNVIDSLVTDIKSPCQFLLIPSDFCAGFPESANFLCLLLGEFCIWVLAAWKSAARWFPAKKFEGMKMVLTCRYYLKVLKSIVTTNTIFMVDLQLLRNWSYKCFNYQAMYRARFHLAMMTKPNVQVAPPRSWTQNASWLGIIAAAHHSFDFTCIRYFINAFIIRDRFPFHIHSLPCIELGNYTTLFQLCQSGAEET